MGDMTNIDLVVKENTAFNVDVGSWTKFEVLELVSKLKCVNDIFKDNRLTDLMMDREFALGGKFLDSDVEEVKIDGVNEKLLIDAQTNVLNLKQAHISVDFVTGKVQFWDIIGVPTIYGRKKEIHQDKILVLVYESKIGELDIEEAKNAYEKGETGYYKKIRDFFKMDEGQYENWYYSTFGI